MEKNKKIDFSIGIFEDISEKIKKRVKKEADNCEIYGVGVYSDEIIKNEYKTSTMRSEEERMDSAKSLEGVDFVFLVDSMDLNEIKKIVKKAWREVLKNKN